MEPTMEITRRVARATQSQAWVCGGGWARASPLAKGRLGEYKPSYLEEPGRGQGFAGHHEDYHGQAAGCVQARCSHHERP